MTQYQRQKQGGVVINFVLAIYKFEALASVRMRRLLRSLTGTDHEQASHGL